MLEFIEQIIDFIVSLFSGKEKKDKKDSGKADGNCPACGKPVFLSDKEFKNGHFTCRKCGYGAENTRLK